MKYIFEVTPQPIVNALDLHFEKVTHLTDLIFLTLTTEDKNTSARLFGAISTPNIKENGF